MYRQDNMLRFATPARQRVALAILQSEWRALRKAGVVSWTAFDTRWNKTARDRTIQFATASAAETAFLTLANFRF